MALPDLAGDPKVAELVAAAVREDVGSGDATTLALVAADSRCEGVILAREPCVVSGLPVAAMVFRTVDARTEFEFRGAEGDEVVAGAPLATVRGPSRGILTGERTALNFMQRMSGIATMTRRFVRQVRDRGVTVLDTRKTTPGLRVLEKYAVLCGGGCNHRAGLYDRILVKDNHRRLWRLKCGATLADAVRAAREKYPGLEIEVEVETEQELVDVLCAGPDWVLLDNMSPERLASCARLCAGRARLEASGGIGLDGIEAVASSGVDAVSLGCLTHSARAIDLSLELT